MDEQGTPRKNLLRRSAGIVVALFPLLLLAASVFVGMNGSQIGTFEGAGLMIAANAIAILNFYLSFVRPRVHARRHGSLDAYRHVSGFPGIGTALVVLGAAFGFGAIGTALLGVVAMFIDSGGPIWFLWSTWHDDSMWDA